MQNLVDFFQIAEKLECEYRLTRMSDGKKQAVASHSWNMAMMAMVLQPYLKTNVNMERVYQLCLLHDLPEAITHDVPLHMQTDDIRAKKQLDEAAAVKQIMDVLNDVNFGVYFAEYNERQTAEARLVKALDVLDTAVQHLCAQDLSYIGEYKDNFYWKLFFSDGFIAFFDFEPVMYKVVDLIRQRVAERLELEQNIDVSSFINKSGEYGC